MGARAHLRGSFPRRPPGGPPAPSTETRLGAVGAGLAAVALLAAAASLLHPLLPARDPSEFFNPFHVASLAMVDTAGRNLLYRTGVVALLGLIFLRPLLGRASPAPAPGAAPAAAVLALLLAIPFHKSRLATTPAYWPLAVAAAAAAWKLGPRLGERARERLEAGCWLVAAALAAQSLGSAAKHAVGGHRLALVPAAAAAAALLAGRRRAWTAPAAVLLLVPAAWLLPPFKPLLDRLLDFSALTTREVVFAEMHVATVFFGAADGLAKGLELGGVVRPSYGFLQPALAALAARSGWTLDWAGYAQAAFALQALSLACWGWLYWKHSGRDGALLLAALPAAAYWNHPGAEPHLFPNLGAPRFFFVPLLLALLLPPVSKRKGLQAALACLVLSLSLLSNVELGIILCASWAAYHWLRWRRDGSLRSAARCGLELAAMGAAVAAAAGTLFSLLCLALGQGLRNPAVLLEMLGNAARGFAGLPLSWDRLALFGAAAAVIQLFASVRPGLEGRDRHAFRAAAGVLLLLWGAYYVNRPDPSCLRLHLALLSLFMLDGLRLARAELRRLRRRTALPAWRAAAALCLVLWSVALSSRAAAELGAGLGRWAALPPAGGSEKVGGVALSASLAERLRGAAEVWRERRVEGDPCVLLTAHSILLPALTCRPELPFSEPYAAVFTRADYARLVEAIRDSGARRVFFDPLEAPGAGSASDYYRRLREDLRGSYRELLRTPHLDVWERLPQPVIDASGPRD